MGDNEKPQWATRLVEEREVQTWTQVELARELQQLAPSDVPLDIDSIVRSIKGWESGKVRPGAKNRRLLAKLFGTSSKTLFGPDDEGAAESAVVPGDALALAEIVAKSDLSSDALDSMTATVEKLCTRYSTDDPEEVWREASELFEKVSDLLQRSEMTNTEERIVLTQAGWLSLLVGCLEHDMGRTDQAERSRQAALKFGVASDQPRIIAWAYEMSAWFAESVGDDDLVIKATRAGQEAAPASDVAVQLAGKEAEVLARRGDRKGAKEVLDRAIQWIEDLPYPDNPGNHFTVDPYKFDKVAMRVSRLLGDYDAADLYAKQIIRKGMRPDGTHVMPMRVADAKSSMAVTALERGNVAEAVRLGNEALDIPRQSLPSLRLVIAELIQPLKERHPHADGVAALVRRFEQVQESLSAA